MSGPFFVGGTGRCGTSQLTRVLGEHPQVHALEWESRFLVDPGGFEDLARALTVAYTPYHADDALGRLAWLLNVRLTGHSKEVFRGWGLAEELGIERYRAAVGRLWQQLAWYEFDEAVPPLGYRSGLDHAPGEPRLRRRVVARYFPDRAELTGISGEFTAGLFGAAAEAAGKRTWCEKTPLNLLSVPFLLELFPEASVVVIMRHPVHVAASHLDQPWAPSTLEGVEVKAEILAASWPDSRRELFGRLGLADADTVNTFAAGRLAAWRGQLSDTEYAEVVGRLGWAAGELGYPARSCRPAARPSSASDSEFTACGTRRVTDDPGRLPAEMLQEIMDLASITATLDLYGHPYPGDVDRYADRLGQAVAAVNDAFDLAKTSHVGRQTMRLTKRQTRDQGFRWRAREDSNPQLSDP